MNKVKIAGAMLGLGVMVFATPVVFDKLMNAKLAQMIKELQKKGIQIEEINNKSSYLKTNKVFKVVIPGNVINVEGVKDLVLEVGTEFKNLPVTKVDFKGKILRIDFYDKEFTQKFNQAIKDKINFVVITPDFKLYRYKILDNDIVFEDADFIYKSINGVYYYPEKNDLKIGSFLIKGINDPVSFEFKNNHIVTKNEKFKKSSDYTGNLFFKVQNIRGSVLNICNNTLLTFRGKYATYVNNSGFDALTIQNFGKIENFKAKFELNHLLSSAVYKFLKNPKDKRYLNKIFKEGFSGSGSVSIKKVTFKSNDLGFFNFNSKLRVLPIKNNNINNEVLKSHLIVDTQIKTTPAFMGVLSMVLPQLIILAKPSSDGSVKIEIKYDKGKIIVNGTPIN
ncbi:MAG: hypothetical protein ABGX23_03605 [Nautiliaceae bacterium]